MDNTNSTSKQNDKRKMPLKKGLEESLVDHAIIIVLPEQIPIGLSTIEEDIWLWNYWKIKHHHYQNKSRVPVQRLLKTIMEQALIRRYLTLRILYP
jgi:hypothetical protein